MGIGTTSLVSMEAGKGRRSLEMCMNGSLVKYVEVFLLIPGSVLGKMTADRLLKDRLLVGGIEDIEHGRTNTNEDTKRDPEEGCRKILTDGKNILSSHGSEPSGPQSLHNTMDGEVEETD